jgi:hypothetical protein
VRASTSARSSDHGGASDVANPHRISPGTLRAPCSSMNVAFELLSFVPSAAAIALFVATCRLENRR